MVYYTLILNILHIFFILFGIRVIPVFMPAVCFILYNYSIRRLIKYNLGQLFYYISYNTGTHLLRRFFPPFMCIPINPYSPALTFRTKSVIVSVLVCLSKAKDVRGFYLLLYHIALTSLLLSSIGIQYYTPKSYTYISSMRTPQNRHP